MPYFSRMARASAPVLPSGTVGPEATTAGSSPGTSDTTSVTTRAGWQASASRPPLIADRWRRTRFISPIGAPQRSSSRFSARFSSKLMPGAGSDIRAEPPPDTRHSTRSSGPSPAAASSMRRAASSPAASGTGWPASITSM